MHWPHRSITSRSDVTCAESGPPHVNELLQLVDLAGRRPCHDEARTRFQIEMAKPELERAMTQVAAVVHTFFATSSLASSQALV